ncbi:MAG: 3-hydroxyacyl-CoA dehydrogenase family protein, partial [Roseovarius sp.]|uniref:3-hydroxyacyl-CoA dehydrogenase family protein n=1 Tax=Roseovarius sp. TaxID=1486281 RepID=UPI00405862E5
NGLGTHLSIAEYLYPDLCDRHDPSPSLTALVERGHLGKRSGKGFYDWPEAESSGPTEEALRRVIALARGSAD